MRRNATIWIFSIVLGIGAVTNARADYQRGQDGNPVVGPDGNPVHVTKLEAVCGPSLARFCPDLTIAPGQSRNEIICLKPYRANLSPSCRAAIVPTVKK